MNRYELEYRGCWIEICLRPTLVAAGIEFAADVRVTEDPEETPARQWTVVAADVAGFDSEAQALENAMCRGLEWVDRFVEDRPAC